MREVIPAVMAGERVDRVVALLTGLPRSDVADLVRAGAVQIGGRAVTTRSTRVVEGDVVEVEAPAPAAAQLVGEPGVVVEVVHEDEHVIVVDKTPDLVVHPGAGHPTGTLVHGLLARYPELAVVGEANRPGIVHRLDRGTSGLLVVARTALAYPSLVEQLSARTVDRAYLALVWGDVEAPGGLVDAPIGRASRDATRMAVSARGREARTRYETLARFTEPEPVSLLECRLETGRTHQIRVHLAAIGHPVVGDRRYRGARPALAAPRPFLHAFHLAFDHPGSGRRVEFESPLPADLEEVRERVR